MQEELILGLALSGEDKVLNKVIKI